MKSNRFQLILRFWFWNGYPSTQYSSIQRRESCLTRNMARFYYECNTDLKNYTEDSETIKPYACTSDKYCLYCCCNSQCCLLVQKRPPRHFWEAWYFWLGIALLAVFIVSLVSSYIVSNCRHNIQGVPLRHSAHGNRRNDRGGHSTNNQNEISISIIPTSEFFPSHRKMFVITSQPAVNHLTPVVAWSRFIFIGAIMSARGSKELVHHSMALYAAILLERPPRVVSSVVWSSARNIMVVTSREIFTINASFLLGPLRMQ